MANGQWVVQFQDLPVEDLPENDSDMESDYVSDDSMYEAFNEEAHMENQNAAELEMESDMPDPDDESGVLNNAVDEAAANKKADDEENKEASGNETTKKAKGPKENSDNNDGNGDGAGATGQGQGSAGGEGAGGEDAGEEGAGGEDAGGEGAGGEAAGGQRDDDQDGEEEADAVAGAAGVATGGAPVTICQYPSIFQYSLSMTTEEEKKMNLSEEELCRRKEQRFWQAFEGFVSAHEQRGNDPEQNLAMEREFRQLQNRDKRH